jgi:hypothetical protein
LTDRPTNQLTNRPIDQSTLQQIASWPIVTLIGSGCPSTFGVAHRQHHHHLLLHHYLTDNTTFFFLPPTNAEIIPWLLRLVSLSGRVCDLEAILHLLLHVHVLSRIPRLLHLPPHLDTTPVSFCCPSPRRKTSLSANTMNRAHPPSLFFFLFLFLCLFILRLGLLPLL